VNTTVGNLNSLSFRKGFSTRVGVWNTTKNSLTLNAWNHVVVTYNNDSSANNPTIYINGASVTVTTRTSPSGTPQSDIGRTMRLFNYVGALTRGLQGYLDEVRASHSVRTASWILTEYNNQNSPSTFISVGSEKSSPCGLGPGPWYVQSAGKHYNGGSSGTVTLPGSTIVGRLLVLSVIFDSTTLNVASVSDSVNGAVYNLALSPTTTGTGWKMYTYYVNNSAAGGPITATVTLSGSTSSILDIFLTEYGAIALVSPLDKTSAGTGSGTSMNSGSQTTTTASEMIYGFGAGDGECHGTAPYIDRETTDAMCVMDRNVTSTGSYSVAATQSHSGYWGLQMATFKGA
jgi:Concanavalin A-like lectin/glucanases superfamily